MHSSILLLPMHVYPTSVKNELFSFPVIGAHARMGRGFVMTLPFSSLLGSGERYMRVGEQGLRIVNCGSPRMPALGELNKPYLGLFKFLMVCSGRGITYHHGASFHQEPLS